MLQKFIPAFAAFILISVSTQSFAQSSDKAAVDRLDMPGVSYGTRPGTTKLQFSGTSLMPGASGLATVEKRGSAIRISAQFTALQSPTTFGHEYLCFVVWALTPDGRAFNLGELVLPDDRSTWTSQSVGSRGSANITTPHQTFAMVITAEPYYAVKVPSRAVVMVNGFAAGMEPLQKVDISFDFARAGGYAPTGFMFDAVLLRTNLPIDFFQARNALRIAQAAGAETYAASVFSNAAAQMRRADELAGQKRVDKRGLTVAAREAVQTAEDARDIADKASAVKREDDARRAEAEARARAQAELEQRLQDEARRAAAAESQRIAAEAERLAADRRREEADRANREAQAAAQAAQRERAAAEELRAAALAQQKAAEAEAARNQAVAAELDQRLQQAIREREDLRGSLLKQLNVILETRDTARGLVVNISDVTFTTGQATLQPAAREKLARVSGILAAHPDLKLELEGHTDSVGSDALNQSLSQRRADAVRAYLIQQGVPAGNASAVGFGKTRPVASNDTAEGRQLNRRVELVVSGESIGATAP